jgi:hypothetical protein
MSRSLQPPRSSRTLAALAALATVAACQARAPAPEGLGEYPLPAVLTEGEPVAEVGPVQLTSSELTRRLREQSPFARAQLADPERRRRFLEGEIQTELLAQEAWRRGLHRDPKVLAEVKRLVVQRLVTQELEGAGKLTVDDAELIAAYQARESEFNKPERVRLSQIVRYADDDGERRAARKLLESVQARVLAAEKKGDPQAFGAAAREHSEDEDSKNGGGDLNFLSKDELAERYGAEVAAHMFERVTIGDMALADAPNAVLLFKKTGLRRGTQQSLDVVKTQLRGQVLAEKRTRLYQALVERLKTERGAKIDEAALERIQLPTDEAAPNSVPPPSAAGGAPPDAPR